jgi:hypothetical protein
MPNHEIVSLIISVPLGFAGGGVLFYYWHWVCRQLTNTYIGRVGERKGLWRLSACLAFYSIVRCLIDLLRHQDPAAVSVADAQEAVMWATAYCGSYLVWRSRNG